MSISPTEAQRIAIATKSAKARATARPKGEAGLSRISTAAGRNSAS
jgi:hypothetical protein